MVTARWRDDCSIPREFQLENIAFAHGTTYVGIQVPMISFLFAKPTVQLANMLCNKSMSLELENIIVFTIY